MTKLIILVTRNDTIHGQDLKECLMHSGFQVNEETYNLTSVPSNVIVGTSQEDTQDELRVAEHIRCVNHKLPFILISTPDSKNNLMAAVRTGLNSYFKSNCSDPFLPEHIPRDDSSNLPQRHSTSNAIASSEFSTSSPLVGESQAMQHVKTFLPKIAKTDCSVFITGETGTGKELVANQIHQQSSRRNNPLVSINCAALPDNLLESELFGYEKGAFTGAYSSNIGKLKLADRGTFFFDEIGDMSPYAQAKILRCLESTEIYPLGGKQSIPLNIRIIAATNQNPERLVTENNFRKDLYYRLNVARVHLPPLRERKEDIPILFNHYLQKMNLLFGKHVKGICSEALDCLLQHDWPGNIRELKNLLEAIFINPPTDMISSEDFPSFFREQISTKDSVLDERALLLSTLFSTNWNKSKAAQKLHWSRMTLYRKMQKYHIQHNEKGRDHMLEEKTVTS